MKIVIFKVDEKEYGVNITQVREVIRMRSITHVPDTGEFVEGVISLRGKVIPLVNLRKKLSLKEKPLDRLNRIIVIKTDHYLTGVIVDKVTDVVSIDNAQISPPDEILKRNTYLIGVAKTKEHLILIVDLSILIKGDNRIGLEKVYERVEVRKRSD